MGDHKFKSCVEPFSEMFQKGGKNMADIYAAQSRYEVVGFIFSTTNHICFLTQWWFCFPPFLSALGILAWSRLATKWNMMFRVQLSLKTDTAFMLRLGRNHKTQSSIVKYSTHLLSHLIRNGVLEYTWRVTLMCFLQ